MEKKIAEKAMTKKKYALGFFYNNFSIHLAKNAVIKYLIIFKHFLSRISLYISMSILQKQFTLIFFLRSKVIIK